MGLERTRREQLEDVRGATYAAAVRRAIEDFYFGALHIASNSTGVPRAEWKLLVTLERKMLDALEIVRMSEEQIAGSTARTKGGS